MSDPSSPDPIEAANAYETVFVPALLREWPPIVAEAVRLAPGQRVLDVACGTGLFAREAVTRTNPGGSVTGIDPDPGMLAVARTREPSVDWRLGTAESLPFADASFDVVVSQFGLMFFRDPGGAIREMVRVLVDGGRLAVAVWDALDDIPAYATEVRLLERLGGREAADALRAPFVFGDRARLLQLFERAGATSVHVTTHRGHARFPSVRVMVEADLRGWLPIMGVHLSEERIARILEEAEHDLRTFVHGPEEAEHDLRTFVHGDGVSFETRAHVVTARKGRVE